MVIKSVPMDDKSVIVFAIRGTATFMDWAVNLNMEPSSPVGFLVSAMAPLGIHESNKCRTTRVISATLGSSPRQGAW